ncbi:MAG: hypothetical protein GY798_09555 [Hyphomicrobiales bacterium]|nr:hypothetical protein [Hyphomicrobiales bacterium]
MPTAAIVAVVGGAGLPLLLGYSGANTLLGAHPWWAVSVAWIGMPIGALFAAVVLWTERARWPATGIALLFGICAAIAAHFGVLEFIASHADNRLAGRVWYCGWIATMAALAGFVILVLWPRRRAWQAAGTG